MPDKLKQDEKLIEQLLTGAQVVKPEPEEDAPDEEVRILANYDWDPESRGKRRGLPFSTIRDDLYELTGGWPTRRTTWSSFARPSGGSFA